jgi:predicted nucleotidyltransferase component of viral defense system
MTTSTQLKALIRNLSSKTHIDAEVLLRNFMLERFLERIAVSEYKDNFILKGGMLIAAMVGIDTRSTMDMDATIKGQALTAKQIINIMSNILACSIDDGVVFTYQGIDEIREESDYPGFRVSIGAVFDKTKQMLKIDITTGDYVTPREISYPFKLMFEDRTINIMAYTLETVLAEKFETIISRSTANTRMRDFYDIYILTNSKKFDKAVFNSALQKTAEKRGTAGLIKLSDNIIVTVSESSDMILLWERYRAKYEYAADVTWDMVIGAVRTLAKTIIFT